MRYRLRSLLILMGLGPPVLAFVWFVWPILLAFMVYGLAAATVLLGVSALLSSAGRDTDN